MYQAVGYDKKSNTMHVWDDELGHQKFNFKPYAYLDYTAKVVNRSSANSLLCSGYADQL